MVAQETKRGVIYARISSEDQSVYSLPSQKRVCKEKMEKDGVKEVCGPFEDEESGFKEVEREGFSNLMRRAIAGEIDYVYVYDLDRLGRHVAETPYLMHRLKQMGVIVRDRKEEYCFDDPFQYVYVSIKCYRAHVESVRIGERSKEGILEKLKEGKWVGDAPFGLRVNAGESLEENPEIAPIYLDFFQMYATNGDDCKTVAQRITKKYPSLGLMKPDRLRRLLRNRAAIGELKWAEFQVNRPDLRLIPQDLWQAVQEKLDAKSKLHIVKRKRKPYSLWDDLAIEYGKEYVICMLKEVKPVCPKCGSIMGGNGNKKVLGIEVPNFKCSATVNRECKYQKTIPDEEELKCFLKEHISCPVCRAVEQYDKVVTLDGSTKFGCKRCDTIFEFNRNGISCCPHSMQGDNVKPKSKEPDEEITLQNAEKLTVNPLMNQKFEKECERPGKQFSITDF